MAHRIGDIKALNLIVLRDMFAKSIVTDELLAGISLRVPTLTTAEKNLLPAADGTIIYDKTLGDAQVFSGGGWTSISGGNLSSPNPVDITSTASSTGTGSGALVVLGGVGIGEDLNVGGAINIGGSSTFTDTTQSIDSSTGALVVGGGVGIGKTLSIGEDLNVTGDTTLGGTLTVNDLSIDTLSTTGIVDITDSTQSIDEMSGALVVDGGVGIAKTLNIGEDLNVNGNSTIGGSITVGSGGTSNALIVDGAAHIQGNLVVDDSIMFDGRFTGRVRTTASSTNLDNDYILNVTTGATITLPDLSNNLYTGVMYHLVKETTSVIVINTAVIGDKIINAGIETTTISLTGPIHERVTLTSNGNRWYTM